MMDKVLGIIPSRYASTRFPGKPLANIKGKSMVQRVYEAASKTINMIVVATDDERIYKHVSGFGGKAVMTSTEHRSGTDRCVEALDIFSARYDFVPDIVVNIQGDEPFLHPDDIKKLHSCFDADNCQIATLVKQILNYDDLHNPNNPKVVIGTSNQALYFSRSPIPFFRNAEPIKWSLQHKYYKHIGLYGYRTKVLREVAQLPQSRLELAESLEQLRWIENGYSIHVAETEIETPSVDTPEDLEAILNNPELFK